MSMANLQKMAQQTRFAIFDVERPDQPLGEPDVIIIGKVSYVRTGTQWERIELGESMAQAVGNLSELRKELVADQVRCTSAGSGTLRGVAVAKYHYEGARDKTETRGTVWIDQRAGLPVYEASRDGSGDGMVVMYGNAVKEPKVAR